MELAVQPASQTNIKTNIMEIFLARCSANFILHLKGLVALQIDQVETAISTNNHHIITDPTTKRHEYRGNRDACGAARFLDAP